MSYEDYFPTDFAKEIARKVFIYPKKDLYEYEDAKLKKMNARHMRLKQFQQICALGTYDEAIIIYQNIKIDAEQKTALKLIAETTPLQMQGVTIQSMIKIIIEKQTHKDYAKILDLMMEVTGKKDGSGLLAIGKEINPLIINTTIRKKD